LRERAGERGLGSLQFVSDKIDNWLMNRREGDRGETVSPPLIFKA